jgi:hypothetical protein
VGESRSIRVISSCTSLKVIGGGDEPVAAERLYAGEQHRRLMRGVTTFRTAETGLDLDLWIVSAGHGLVHGDVPLPHYDTSFAGLSRGEIERRAAALDIPAATAALLSKPAALTLLLLGEDYAHAAALGPKTTLGGATLAFGGASAATRLRGLPRLKVVPAGKAEARRFSCGLVGLKGELAGRLLGCLAQRPQLLHQVGEHDFDVLGLIDKPAQETLLAAA